MDDRDQDCVDTVTQPGTSSDTKGGEVIGPAQAYTKEEHDDVQYRMRGENRVRAIILNNKDFVCGKRTRTGTDEDASDVCDSFNNLGFKGGEAQRQDKKTDGKDHY
ncbi:uncharacterized protein LOC124283967 [Haliotis rubra]|uniref:uncharacterized protein LOC124283967 n=1 Tax=Haliotis rubra TaxID=36100 RepID=UPI001EE60445|nr:uncharacterized protein LOC124283967 [Haliotis rubra]